MQPGPDRVRIGLICRARGQEQAQPVGPIQRHAPVVLAQAPGADPDHLSRSAELIEQSRGVAGDAGRQYVSLEHARGQGHALQLPDHLGQAVGAGQATADAVPRGQEPGQGGRLHGLDLAAQPRQRPPPDESQHLRLTPLALDPAGPELTAQEDAIGHQPFESRLHDPAR